MTCHPKADPFPTLWLIRGLVGLDLSSPCSPSSHLVLCVLWRGREGDEVVTVPGPWNKAGCK